MKVRNSLKGENQSKVKTWFCFSFLLHKYRVISKVTSTWYMKFQPRSKHRLSLSQTWREYKKMIFQKKGKVVSGTSVIKSFQYVNLFVCHLSVISSFRSTNNLDASCNSCGSKNGYAFCPPEYVFLIYLII